MQKKLSVIGEIVLDIVVIVGLVLLIRTFIMSPYQVSGSSMCPTFNYENSICESDFGEYLIVAKFKYLIWEPERGDIIVFRPPYLAKNSREEFFIKRIIGIPGDTLEIKNGSVYIDDKKLDEPYLKGKKTHIYGAVDNAKFEVPEGKYFVMGDNRENSTDSRVCFRDGISGGCKGGKSPYVMKDMMEGKVWVTLLPLHRIGLIKDPEY